MMMHSGRIEISHRNSDGGVNKWHFLHRIFGRRRTRQRRLKAMNTHEREKNHKLLPLPESRVG